ncbi:carbohydrate porin [Pseudomonas sp. OIL-1]|uniref:carbohydrate porin n=1 Tax=Pseudomonas sp. OIL-1 TaxID=2706126 RepID=UPI0035317EDD
MKPAVSVQALPGEYRLGYYHSSASAGDVYQDINSRPHGVTGLAFKSRSGKSGWWVMGRQQLTAREGDASRGIHAFANFTFHDKDTSSIDSFQNIGVVHSGLFDANLA